MELYFKDINFKIDWKVLVAFGGLALLNKLSNRGQLKSFELDINKKCLSLNS